MKGEARNVKVKRARDGRGERRAARGRWQWRGECKEGGGARGKEGMEKGE